MTTLIRWFIIKHICMLFHKFLFFILSSNELRGAHTLGVENPGCTFWCGNEWVAALVSSLPRLHITIILFGHSEIRRTHRSPRSSHWASWRRFTKIRWFMNTIFEWRLLNRSKQQFILVIFPYSVHIGLRHWAFVLVSHGVPSHRRTVILNIIVWHIFHHHLNFWNIIFIDVWILLTYNILEEVIFLLVCQ